MVTLTPEGQRRRAAELNERQAILERCSRPISVVELSAYLRLPLAVAQVLTGDLADDGFLCVHQAPEMPSQDRDLLRTPRARRAEQADGGGVMTDGGEMRQLPVKLIIAGGFGVGKTTFVASASDIEPLTTEAAMTTVAEDVDDVGEVTQKTTTTVAMDFGRLSLEGGLNLFLFGTPGQDRFGFMWDDLCRGAVGAIVLIDSRRFEDCWPAVEYFERTGMPFAAVVNRFDGRLAHDLDEVREALDVPSSVPILDVDARDRQSALEAIVVLLHHCIARVAAGV